MTWRTRSFGFPGGVLELHGAGDESEDCPGFYLELRGTDGIDSDHEATQGTVMRYKPSALGYLRTDVSGIAQLWDESQIRKTASELGYDFSGMVVYDPKSSRSPLARLKSQATRLDAEAVIVPGPEHFEAGQIPDSLMRQLTVITVYPVETNCTTSSPAT